MGSDVKRNVFVAGHKGMVGSAILRVLQSDDAMQLVTSDRSELDLENQTQVSDFLGDKDIDEIYLCAAKVGGIYANNEYPAEFIYSNLKIETNIIHEAYRSGINKILFLGSSCIYPRECAQPITESALLTSTLEATNEPYAIAKIAGIKLCESYNQQYGTDYRSVMPTNLYGQNDNFHPENSHVIPGLISRIHLAKIKNAPSVSIWGTGVARREFLHVDDMADACVFVMNLDKERLYQQVSPRLSHINIGMGVDVSIKELAQIIAEVVGYQGVLEYDTSKPDGTPRKLLDVSKLHTLGWQHQIELKQGLNATYQWYCRNLDSVRQS